MYYWYMWHTCTMLLFELHVRVFNTTCVCYTCNIQHFHFSISSNVTYFSTIQVFLLHVIYILLNLIHMHTLLLFEYLHCMWNIYNAPVWVFILHVTYNAIIRSLIQSVPLDPPFVLQVSSKDEDFLDLSVDVEQNTSITHCLRGFSSMETLSDEHKYYCEVCGTKQEAQKRWVVNLYAPAHTVLSMHWYLSDIHFTRFYYQL